MSNPTANVNISIYSCWLPEVPLPVYPSPIVLPPPIPPLPNPPLPFPDTSGLPDPEIIPADYCSKLIYTWLMSSGGPHTPSAVALLAEVLPNAFDTLDTSAYDAALQALIDQYNADVAQLEADYLADVLARQLEIDQLAVQLQLDIAQIDADYLGAYTQRATDMAECEASRYPDLTTEPGLGIKLLTHGISNHSAATSSTGLRTVLRVSLAA